MHLIHRLVIEYLLPVFIIFIIPLNTCGQSIAGSILDKNKNPISAAQILNKANGIHTHSDENGHFELVDVTVGDSLSITHISYETRVVAILEMSSLDIVLFQKLVQLEEVSIKPAIDALNLITNIDIQMSPVNSSQDILRRVPGLFIGQHAGGGKAEQIFLRGFDIDHGTDITITVDGIPVNMVSHAHGQGYADLHFIIPETIDKIDFGKGPYYSDKGNFNTAGYVDFNTKENIEKSEIKLERGDFNTNRVMGMFDLFKSDNSNAYVASEFLTTDGPFESPQNFSRVNLFAKYNMLMPDYGKLGLSVSRFYSEWDASGQIPERAVAAGNISRFGAIDDTEGGNTSRTNILIDYDKYLDNQSFIRNKLFYSHYDFELYSNFTFFLNDSVNGDQIRQKEDRSIYGLESSYNRSFSNSLFKGDWQAGVSFRSDRVEDNELSRTRNRSETLEQVQFGNVLESNTAIYLNSNFDFNKWRINMGLRYDFFDFQYTDQLSASYLKLSANSDIFSPKINILFNQSEDLQLYVKSGRGFHSNDSRIVIDGTNQALAEAYGYDLGFIWKPIKQLVINSAFWYLYMEQELVYVGDEGIVEVNGRTQRQGIDLSIRYQPLEWLFWNLDANFADPHFLDEEEEASNIPLAPDFSLVSALTVQTKAGFNTSLQMRYLDDRPANETNSIVALGYTILDANFSYEWNDLILGLQVQNVLDSEWNEAQFATLSRLAGESQAVEELHFTPGSPQFFKGSLTYRF